MHPNSAEDTSAATGAVLFVDDERDILPEYQELLEDCGFCALTESDPEKVLATVLEQTDIVVMITDLRMARLDGFGLIRQLRSALPPERKLQFIVLTGDATLAARHNPLDVPVILKPVDVDELVTAIGKALKRSK